MRILDHNWGDLVGQTGSHSPACGITLVLDHNTRTRGLGVRPDMRYCFRSGRFRPNPRTKHISVPPRHMTKSYIPDFNMISQNYRYKDATSHTTGIQLPQIHYNSGRHV